MKDILRGLLVLSVLLLKVPTANGQGTSLPQVIQPSPQSAELIRRIEFPAATYTGIPGNEIVLFNLESKVLKLPISLSYNFSGLRPAEKQGILGLGWSLNAGGRITRNINKYPDEQCYNLLIKDESEIIGSTDYTDSDDDFLYLKNAVEGSNDLAIDNFYYNIVGLSGQFIFKRNTDIEEFIKPILLPYQGINIEPHYLSENNGSFDYFEITDCNGTLYRFGKSILTGTVATERYLSISSPTAPFENGISSWLLTEIISSDRSDTIFFMYSDMETGASGNTVEVSHRVFSRSYNKLFFDLCSSGYSHSSNDASISAYGFTQKKLTRIKYKRGRIDFTYSQDDYPDCVMDIHVLQSSRNLPLPRHLIH